MATLPLAVLLYDRTFLAGSFRVAWRRRWGLYLGLAATWGALGLLFLFSAGRGAWAGFGLTLGKMEEARILVEVGGGNGTINFTTATVTAQ